MPFCDLDSHTGIPEPRTGNPNSEVALYGYFRAIHIFVNPNFINCGLTSRANTLGVDII